MRTIKLGRPSPSFVVAMVALVAALAGTAIALPGKNSVTSNDIKKNSVKSKTVKDKSLTGKDVKDGSLNGADVADEGLTGADVQEATLGQVPSAAGAATVVPFSVGANEDSVVSLVKTDTFELMAVCDANGSFAVPLATAFFEYNASQSLGSTTFFIVNRGTAPAFGDSDDDEDFKLETGEAIAFNYDDPGDGGQAFTPAHSMSVPGYANLSLDTADINSPNADDDPTGFPNACHFAGTAFVS